MVADHKVCIIMLGESGVGKTSLMLRFCKNYFREAHSCTSIDYYNKTILLNDKKVELELWDTAGQERFKAIIKEYFRKADGVLLVYDTTNLETFCKLSSWLEELRGLNEEATIVVVANKADLPQQSQVSRRTCEKYAREEDLDFCETSAKNNENVDEVFKNLALKVLERKKISPFFKVLVNGEIKSESMTKAASDSSKQLTDKDATDSSKQQTKDVTDSSKQQTGMDATDSRKQQTENNSLPPIIRLEDDFGNDIHWIKLTVEKPKMKQKGCC